ncbi:hypothetical protein HSBAA_28120 [Vreelandella sulfidaeris]|uniref:biotin carboxylase n=1 Tax=Vreelandella sulfidaeris TaxID=115553 RepID=A0A455U5V6_9GAMM|nr:hypothetical protein HSBAA_28120 [Halomonas sulfidaeris]
MDSHLYTGYTVPPHYDSLIGKLITWGADREIALTRMRNALDELLVEGIKTNIDLQKIWFVTATSVKAASIFTTWKRNSALNTALTPFSAPHSSVMPSGVAMPTPRLSLLFLYLLYLPLLYCL